MTAPGQTKSPINQPRTPPYIVAGLVLLLIAAVVLALVWTQFRGGFSDPEKLTLISSRSGLSMDPGSKVTFNGVEIGRVAGVSAINQNGVPSWAPSRGHASARGASPPRATRHGRDLTMTRRRTLLRRPPFGIR